jgi:T cell receptor alpha chain V region
VTQKEGEVTLSEGAFLTINCTYTAKGYPELSWYVQYPGESLQLLFRVTKSGEKGSHRGFEATYNRETTSFHLEKATVHKSDSARYYCVLGDTVAETTAGAEHKLSSSRDLAAGCLLWNPSGLSTVWGVILCFSGAVESYKLQSRIGHPQTQFFIRETENSVTLIVPHLGPK